MTIRLISSRIFRSSGLPAVVFWRKSLLIRSLVCLRTCFGDAGADQAKVGADTLDLIRAFLHPTRGGPDGAGWQVGQPVFTSDLFRAIMPAEDIGYIATLQVAADIPACREVGGDAARYYLPGDPRSLADAIGSIFEDPTGSARLAQAAHDRGKRFQWRDNAVAFHATLRRAAGFAVD